MRKPPYAKSVFINCPFDGDYLPLFEAIIFTICSLGFVPRSTKEFYDSGTRLDKIISIITGCQFGIHDLSDTKLNSQTELPRFNMPFELGIDIGCRYVGGPRYAKKSILIMDRTLYRYQKFISDLAGYDPTAHGNKIEEVIRIVRNWLSTYSAVDGLPSAEFIQREYEFFRRDLLRIAKLLKFKAGIPYTDYLNIVADWLLVRRNSVNAQEIAGRALRIVGLFTDKESKAKLSQI